MAIAIEPVWERVRRGSVAGLMRVVGALPDGVAFALGRLCARPLAWVHPRRSWVLEHLGFAFGNELSAAELRVVAARFYEHLCLTFVEIVRLPYWSRERVQAAMAEQVGMAHLDAALAEGKGAILITGHVGNWEMSGAILGMRGYLLGAVMQPQRNRFLREHLGTLRRRHGLEEIPTTSPRGCFACLRRGGVLLLLIDHRHPVGGVRVPFFGRPAQSHTGAATLAMKTGAPVLLGYSYRLPDGRHRGVVSPPIPLVRTGDHERDVTENTARFQAALEAAIRDCPEQWIWSYRRWRQQTPRRRRLGAGEQRGRGAEGQGKRRERRRKKHPGPG